MLIARQYAALLVVVLFLVPPRRCQGQNASRDEYNLFEAANRERRLYGLHSLKWDDALATAAREHAREMSRHARIAHQFPGEPSLPSRVKQAGAQFTWLAENVDASSTADEIQSRLLHSAAHRANILDKDMDSIGVGVVLRRGQLFAVEDFSKAK